jgi:hypothetical protein
LANKVENYFLMTICEPENEEFSCKRLQLKGNENFEGMN